MAEKKERIFIEEEPSTIVQDYRKMKSEEKWLKMYHLAEEYYQQYGNLQVPVIYITQDGYKLGSWVRQMGILHAKGNLTSEQMEMLEKLGINWKHRPKLTWDEYYDLAHQYYLDHGNLRIMPSYMTDDNVKLGRWIAKMKKAYSSGDEILTPERIQQLKDIGMNFK